jgi:3-deoxy-7-phosphoheptulonate synthase
MEEIPLTEEASSFVAESRGIVEAALRGNDDRLVVIVGPCSIHDVAAAGDYAGRLAEAAKPFEDELLVVMRAYFEKPRTTVGWKGLINDPDLDGTFHINKGLRLARRLLADLAAMKVPAGTEFLDTTIPQHIADFISWGAIGARTTESQTHRELASGLSMPVGFKNATDGNIQVAIDAMKAAQQPHWFPGSTKDGVSAILQTTGNDSCHVVLRGGSRTGPNYVAEHVKKASLALEKEGLPTRLMIDLSHANSLKNHERQTEVGADVANQIRAGGPIFGVMIESNLVGGRQNPAPAAELLYGQSVTDACLAFEPTIQLLETLAEAVGAR